MFGTYKPEDVEILLKDITGLVEPLPTKERERRIQSGTADTWIGACFFAKS